MVRESCSRRGCVFSPWAGELQSLCFTWRTPLVPGGEETLKLSLQWNLGEQIARSAGCENRPLLGKLCWCCIISCYPLSVLVFVSMAACSGKGPSRCPDTCTPLWGQCHNLFWATLYCCFLMLPCQLWAVEPISVLSSQGRTFLGSFSGAKFSAFEKAEQAHLKRRLSMKRHLSVSQIADMCLVLTRGLMRFFLSLPWHPEPHLTSYNSGSWT